MESIVITLALLGKLACSAAFRLIQLHSLEVFPTSVRSTGYFACNGAAQVASFCASYVDYW